MNRNPLIPFAITALIGILLMISISYFGINKAGDIAGGNDEGAEQVSTDPEEIYQGTCISCHGQNLEGGAGPALNAIGGKLSAEEIQDVIKNGQGSMPANLVGPEQAEILAEWLAEKK
jgi:cytochrome c550